jgi:hypothetical protein
VAPLSGSVTERTANAGANVDPTMPLFTIVDLSTVWVVGSVYEVDFGRIRVGAPVSITFRVYPDSPVKGRVTYVDPQVNPETRTAQLRVEVSNADRRLKLNMYADVTLSAPGSGAAALVIPRSAVQMVSDRAVVYLAGAESGTFIEREVRLGESIGDGVRVVSGLQAMDRIVTKGSFALRAERERLGLRPSATAPQAPGGATRIVVSEQGFSPSRVQIPANRATHITFVRTSDKTCATEIVVPSLNIKRALPLNQPVDVEIPAQKRGELEFACGMNMFKGTLVVD